MILVYNRHYYNWFTSAPVRKHIRIVMLIVQRAFAFSTDFIKSVNLFFILFTSFLQYSGEIWYLYSCTGSHKIFGFDGDILYPLISILFRSAHKFSVLLIPDSEMAMISWYLKFLLTSQY